MKAAIGGEEKIYLDLQKKLDSYESSMSNSIDSDVWNFDFESFIFPVDFSFFDNLSHQSSDYLLANKIEIKLFVKILLLEVFSRQLSRWTFKGGVDFLFIFIHFFISEGGKSVSRELLEQFLEHYLMHSFSSGEIIIRLSPRNYSTVSGCMHKLPEINSIIGYYGFSRLFDENLSESKISNLLKSSIEIVSAGELTFGDWKKGGTFNCLTLDYGRYYVDYCKRFYEENYEVGLGIAAVLTNMEKHITNAGLTLHKNTKQVFYGLLDDDYDSSSVKYKKYKKEKIQRLRASINEEYQKVVGDALKRKHLLSDIATRSMADCLGIKRKDNREDSKAKYLDELERFRQIVYYYLIGEEESVKTMLYESNIPSSFESFVTAIKNEVNTVEYEPELPTAQFYQCIGRSDLANSQPLSLVFLSKVRSAGITQIVSQCGWRGSEYGFPITAISKQINEDILDQYVVPFRYMVDWYVFKTHGEAAITREITFSAFEIISELSLLNHSKEDEPALYPSHAHASDSTSSSASHSAVKNAVSKNWENFVFHNRDFKILDDAKELQELSLMVSQGQVINSEQEKRLQELIRKNKSKEFQRITQDPNLIEAKRKAEEQFERVMFVTNQARGFYVKGWLVQYQKYLQNSESDLPDKMINVLNASLSQETKLEIRAASIEVCTNRTFITQVTHEVVEDCLYPTPQAFRHMWAEAVYRRFDGDVGWMIRSNFKHVSKNMWLAYIRDKDNRRMHDTIKVRVASSIMKNWLAKEGRDSAGKFHRFLGKLFNNTVISTLENLDKTIERLAREDIISIKANPWGFCIARLSTVKMTKCFDGFDYNPQSANPAICMDCINNLTMSSNIDYIVLHSWQHIDLLMSKYLTEIPTSLRKQSLEYVGVALKRVSELVPGHSIIPKLKAAIRKGAL